MSKKKNNQKSWAVVTSGHQQLGVRIEGHSPHESARTLRGCLPFSSHKFKIPHRSPMKVWGGEVGYIASSVHVHTEISAILHALCCLLVLSLAPHLEERR